MFNYQKKDPEVWHYIKKEEERQQNNIELIASENIVSPDVRAAQGSVLTNKYSEGYPKRRYYGGNQNIDAIESLAIKRAKKLFNAEYVNVQPHSGSQANQAVYAAFLKPGDKILGMGMDSGGHLSHGSQVNFSGKLYKAYSYDLNPQTERLDYDKILSIEKKIKPKMIVAGASAYSRIINWKKFRNIADQVGAFLMVDMAHIAGLIATGFHPSPVGIADVITTTTQKTLRGPRGGLIISQNKYAKKINSAVFPGTQGGPLEHVIAAKAIMLKEDLQPAFKNYAKQIIKNSKAMARIFNNSNLVRVVSGGTDNHLFILDLTKTGLNGKQAQNLLDSISITTNKESIPNDKRSPFKTSGLRIGTPAVTTRGFKEKDCSKVAKLILFALKNYQNKDKLKEISASAHNIVSSYPITNFVAPIEFPK